MTNTVNTAAAISSCTDRQFTKKPVTIQAIQWTGRNLREVIAFTDGPPDTRSAHAGMAWDAYVDLVARDGLKIYTLEGKMSAAVGDWIIKGVKGEHYPCKLDIFEATYRDSTPELHIGDSAFESWYSSYSPMHKSDKQRARDAYAAGMGDPLVTAAPAAVAGCTRSHPHENMDSACRAKAAIAEMRNKAARGAEATAHDLDRFVVMLTAAPTTQPAPQQDAQKPTAVVVPCHTPSGKRVALYSAKQDLPIGTQLYTAPQPSPAAQGDALDTMRLDWLDADESRCVFHLGKSWYTRPSYGLPYRKRASLREAIDAARKEMP